MLFKDFNQPAVNANSGFVAASYKGGRLYNATGCVHIDACLKICSDHQTQNKKAFHITLVYVFAVLLVSCF